MAASGADKAALAALLAEPDDDPGDLAAMDRLWAESAVTFGPGQDGCPKAQALVATMHAAPAPVRRRAVAAG